MIEYEIRDGDTLSHIALRLMRAARKWKIIYALNHVVIHKEQVRRGVELGPDMIFPGTRLRIPTAD